MKYTLSKTTAMVYKIRITEPSHTWADITIEEWAGGGSIKVISDYGDYSYSWNAIGEGVFRDFLLSLDFGYFMEKTKGSSVYKFSPELTINQIKKDILKIRHIRDIDRDTARGCWNDIETYDLETDSETLYHERIWQTYIPKYIYDSDYHAIPVETEINHQCTGFWEIIWPVACEIWREELKEPK